VGCFLLLEQLTAGMGWVDSLPPVNPDGTVNAGVFLYIARWGGFAMRGELRWHCEGRETSTRDGAAG
jgi:hypothetical protein